MVVLPFMCILSLQILLLVHSKCYIESNEALRTLPSAEQEPIVVSFYNGGQAKLFSAWVDPKGGEHDFGEIEPFESVQYNTFVGHAWRIFNDGGVVHEYVASAKKNSPTDRIVIGRDCVEQQKEDDEQEIDGGSPNDGFNLNDDYTKIDTFDKLATFRVSKSFDLIINPPSELILTKTVSKSPCGKNLLPWISRVIVVPGYHVLCIEKRNHITQNNTHNINNTKLTGDETDGVTDTDGVSYEVDAWTQGYNHIAPSARRSYIGYNMTSFRWYLEELLDIPRSDAWHDRTLTRQQQRKQDEDNNFPAEYLPQKWQIFDTNGKKLTNFDNISNSETPLIALVFEGGQFIYPGIEVGYIREVTAHDRVLKLETLSLRPLVLSVRGILNGSEIESIISTAKPQMKASEVSFMDKDKGKADTEFRTSSTYFMPTHQNPYLANIDMRISELTHTDTSQQEYVQVLKYEVGQHYGQHTDFWDPKFYTDSQLVSEIHGGHKNRMITVFWYMSECEGGYTAFPETPVDRLLLSPSLSKTHPLDDPSCPHALKVTPLPGAAIIFYSLLPDGAGDALSLHAACPPTKGTKWAANKWIWNQVKNFLP